MVCTHECSLYITVLLYRPTKIGSLVAAKSFASNCICKQRVLQHYLRMAKAVIVAAVTRPDPHHFRYFLDSLLT